MIFFPPDPGLSRDIPGSFECAYCLADHNIANSWQRRNQFRTQFKFITFIPPFLPGTSKQPPRKLTLPGFLLLLFFRIG
jgi:hypothetical protein